MVLWEYEYITIISTLALEVGKWQENILVSAQNDELFDKLLNIMMDDTLPMYTLFQCYLYHIHNLKLWPLWPL